MQSFIEDKLLGNLLWQSRWKMRTSNKSLETAVVCFLKLKYDMI